MISRKLKHLFTPRRLHVHVDGAIRPENNASGLAAIVRDDQHRIRYWWSRKAGKMTNNQAEYAAAIMALERLRPLRPAEVILYTDSKVLVDQMCGLASVRSEHLRAPFHTLRALAAGFPRVTFQHIPRHRNRLADALASEAVDGI